MAGFAQRRIFLLNRPNQRLNRTKALIFGCLCLFLRSGLLLVSINLCAQRLGTAHFFSTGIILLEPVGTLMASVPNDVTGDIMGEVTKRRGRVAGMHPDDEGMQKIEAEVPVAEMHDFTNYLRQVTQGRGSYNFQFVRYEPLPQMLEGKVIEEAKKFIVLKSDEE